MNKQLDDDHEDDVESDLESEIEEDEFVGLDEDIFEGEESRSATARKRLDDFLEDKRLRDELDDFLDH